MAEKKLDEMSKKELMDMIKNLKKENEELKVTKEFEETNKGNEFDGDTIKANMKIEEENKEKVETKNTNEEIDVCSMTKEEQDEAIKSGKINVIVDGKKLTHEEVMSVFNNGGRFDIEEDSLETRIDKIIDSLPADDQKFIREYKVFINDKDGIISKKGEINKYTYKYTFKEIVMEYLIEGIGEGVTFEHILEGTGNGYKEYDLKEIITNVLNVLQNKDKKSIDYLATKEMKNNMLPTLYLMLALPDMVKFQD